MNSWASLHFLRELPTHVVGDGLGFCEPCTGRCLTFRYAGFVPKPECFYVFYCIHVSVMNGTATGTSPLPIFKT